MTVLTLEDAKLHLRLETGDTAEDAQLQDLIDAAVDYASQFLNRPIPWAGDDGTEIPLPASVRAAILLILGDLYENREGQIVGTIRADNPAVERLLHFYRVGLGV